MTSFTRMSASCLLIALLHTDAALTGNAQAGYFQGSLPSFPHAVELDIAVESDQLEAYDPLIARVTLINRGTKPLALKVHEDGAPASLVSMVARRDEEFFQHDQWLTRSGPTVQPVSLAPDESTAGELLILFGGPPTGCAFSEPGQYYVKFAWQPNEHFAPVYSNVISVVVSPETRGNRGLLDDLSAVFCAHSGWSQESIARSKQEGVFVGIRLLQRVIAQEKPHLVDPDRNPSDRKESELVESLTRLLDRYPNSSYSGYIARFLGLVHVKKFEHDLSRSGAGSWKSLKGAPAYKDIASACEIEYRKALDYLTIASTADLLPRTTAEANLARLHGLAEEWDDASAVCEKLRADYVGEAGAAIADTIESEMRQYRAKLTAEKQGD